MSIGYDYSTNNPFCSRNNVYFRNSSSASNIIKKTIEKVESVINNTVDTFVKKDTEKDEKKKTHKTAITVGSSVLVLSALVAIFNPKFSGKLLDKLKAMSHKAETKAKTNNSAKSKLYQAGQKVLNKSVKFLEFTNNLNSAKDEGFKWLCTDSVFRKVMKKPHEAITNWFDSISKHTVHLKYKRVSSNMNNLENLIRQYKSKLPEGKARELELQLGEINKTREYFSSPKINERLKTQEEVMANLEDSFVKKWKAYVKGYRDKSTKTTEHFKNNMSFWAEDIMMPERNRLQSDGQKVVESLMGDGKTMRGKYNEIYDTLLPYLDKEEKTVLESSIKQAGKKLKKANFSECVEYFDKKRDLILGSAPTDIVTAAAGIILGGVAVGTANSKDERVSRLLTVGMPAVAGIGTSMALTAMLFSGVKGMVYGSLAGVGFSLLGSKTDKIFNPKPASEQLLAQSEAAKKEAVNA